MKITDSARTTRALGVTIFEFVPKMTCPGLVAHRCRDDGKDYMGSLGITPRPIAATNLRGVRSHNQCVRRTRSVEEL
jgi:hypothetical protein